jgi:hypothetical protein
MEEGRFSHGIAPTIGSTCAPHTSEAKRMVFQYRRLIVYQKAMAYDELATKLIPSISVSTNTSKFTALIKTMPFLA